MAAAKKKEKKPIMSCASSGHITKFKQSILRLSISMMLSHKLILCGAKESKALTPVVGMFGDYKTAGENTS